MSWDVSIIPPEGFPDVEEKIISFASCGGNMYTAVRELKKRDLKEMTTDEAISALKDLIVELNKEDKGIFSNNYCVACDLQWSEGRETESEWSKYKSHIKYFPFKNYEEFCGWHIRNRIKETSIRFLLYYVAGYEITYVW